MITSKDYANVINVPIGYSSSELQSDKFSLKFLNNNMSLNMLYKMIKMCLLIGGKYVSDVYVGSRFYIMKSSK